MMMLQYLLKAEVVIKEEETEVEIMEEEDMEIKVIKVMDGVKKKVDMVDMENQHIMIKVYGVNHMIYGKVVIEIIIMVGGKIMMIIMLVG